MNVNGRWTVVMTTLNAPTQMEASPVHVMMVTTETASSASVSFCSSDNIMGYYLCLIVLSRKFIPLTYFCYKYVV